MNLRRTLKRLARSFVVRDIMIPRKQLVCGTDEGQARRLLQEHPDLDVIPIKHGQRLLAFLERDADNPVSIGIPHVVSDGTAILDVVDSFCDRRHLFVLARQEVVGLIHFSDLNDPLVKVPFSFCSRGLSGWPRTPSVVA